MASDFTCFNTIHIMNKLLKCAFGILTAFTLSFASFSNATFLIAGTDDVDMSLFEYHNRVSGGTYDLSPDNYGMTCVKFDEQYPNAIFTDNINNVSITDGLNDWALVCSDSSSLTLQFNSTRSYYYLFFSYENWINELFPKLTSLQCQTEYNLIPISEVTANYCRINFDLISPLECPSGGGSGTGAVNRSAWYINNQQYPGTASLQIRIPDFIKYSVTYNTDETQIDIEGYNADEDYINNIIDNEKLTPTNEDFTYMLTGGMINFFAYMAIAVLFFYLAKVIYKLFK